MLTQGIEDSVSTKKKAGAVCRSHNNLWRSLPSRPHMQATVIVIRQAHMVRMIMQLVGNRRCTLATGKEAGFQASRMASYTYTAIRPGAPSLQHLHLWPVNYCLQKYANADDLVWCDPTAGPRGACGPPQRCQWPAEAFRKSLQIWNLLKSVWGYPCQTELLRWITCICTRTMNKGFSVYHLCLINLYCNQIKTGTALP